MNKVTKLTLATSLLKIDAMLTMARANALEGDGKNFTMSFESATTLMSALRLGLFRDGGFQVCFPASEPTMAVVAPKKRARKGRATS